MHRSEIQDYAAIGDGRSAALVSRDGSVDWLCWPRFDSASVFAGILDARVGGAWRLAPAGASVASRRYLEGSNVLETRFRTATGEASVCDFMSIANAAELRREPQAEHELLRIVTGVSGEVDVDSAMSPRPDYGARTPRFHDRGAHGFVVDAGGPVLLFRSEAPHVVEDGVARATFTVREGVSVASSLSFSSMAPAVLPPLGPHAAARRDRTVAHWQSWSSRLRYDGPHRDAVVRSALVLKLLAFAPSGAIVAAPTTSLPERAGGDLNWDYRFCWLRDAAMTSRSLFALGYPEEAEAFVTWLLHATSLTQPQLAPLYDVYGEAPERERQVPHLDGYQGSRPVRIGNRAAEQRQLDVYGEVVDAAAELVVHTGKMDRRTARLLRQIGEYVCDSWKEPDAGIWELRTRPTVHTHSLVRCWSVLERLLSLSARGFLKIPESRFESARSAIRRFIEERCWNEEIGAYVSEPGGAETDATALLIARFGFDDARSERMQRTFATVVERLGRREPLIHRFPPAVVGGEGAFAICSFWAVEYLARAGRREDAVRWFDAMLGRANDVGLFAEEIDTRTGAFLGNFPQAYTHVGLLEAALTLANDGDPVPAGA